MKNCIIFASHIPSPDKLYIGKIQVEYSAEANNTFTLGSLAGENTPPNFSKSRGSKSVDEFLDEKGRG